MFTIVGNKITSDKFVWFLTTFKLKTFTNKAS